MFCLLTGGSWSTVPGSEDLGERSHGDVGRPEQAGHLAGLQGCWSETRLLVEGADSGDIVANAMSRREAAGEVSDVQVHGGDVWI